MKPNILCKLKRGQVIGAAEGFTDTFNWLVDFADNLKGDGIYITRDDTDPTAPTLNFNPEEINNSGSAGGTTVSVSAIETSGTHIADITVDGSTTALYAPSATMPSFDYVIDVSWNGTSQNGGPGLVVTRWNSALQQVEAHTITFQAYNY